MFVEHFASSRVISLLVVDKKGKKNSRGRRRGVKRTIILRKKNYGKTCVLTHVYI